MASEIAELANSIVGGEDFRGPSSGFPEKSKMTIVSESKVQNEKQGLALSSSSSVMILDDTSQFSRDIDRWMNGETESLEGPVRRRSPIRAPPAQPQAPIGSLQRPALPQSSSLTNTMWYYLLAMVLPVFSFNNCANWRCNPSLVVSTAELFIASLSRICTQARTRIQQIAHDRIVRDLFATAMDVMLVIYAIGFLVLSMYQASVSV